MSAGRCVQHVAFTPGLMVGIYVTEGLNGKVDIVSLAPRKTMVLGTWRWAGIETCLCRPCVPYIVGNALAAASEAARSCAAREYLRGLDSLEGDLERLCEEVGRVVVPEVQSLFDDAAKEEEA